MMMSKSKPFSTVVIDPVFLHQKSEQVEVPFSKQQVLTLLCDMKHFVHKMGGMGIAAPQLGILKRFFVFKKGDSYISVINPSFEILDERKIAVQESCFSCPGVRKSIPRFKRILTSFYSENCKIKTLELTNLDALVFQHEVDHLNGILITDF